MSKIRVLHTITRLVRGGADENTLSTVYGLDRETYDVHLLYGRGSEVEHCVRPERTDVRTSYCPHLCRPLSPVDDLRALVSLVKLLRRDKYDIVHSHTAKAGFLTRLAAYISGTPVVIHTLHGATFGAFLPGWRRHLYVWLEKLASRFSDCLISVGEDLMTRYVGRGIGRPDQHMVIRSGMDLERFRRAPEHSTARIRECRRSLGVIDTEFAIGNISRLEPRKGHEYFIEAARNILSKDVKAKFVIVGDGENRAELQRMVNDLGIGAGVVFTGFRDDIEDVLSSLDVVVLTSLWEGLPRVLVQAAVVGKPIVSFAVEGASEVVADGVNGYLVPLRDTEQLCTRILHLISDPERAKQMGLEGRSIITGDWETTAMVTKIEELYSRLLRTKHIGD